MFATLTAYNATAAPSAISTPNTNASNNDGGNDGNGPNTSLAMCVSLASLFFFL